jgi:Holliday junction resolvase-like predicted endonuclease
MTDTATERDEQIAERRLAGDSVRAVARQFSCSIGEVHAAIERALEINNEVRRRMVLVDAAKLDRLLAVFYEKGLAGCVQSAVAAVRIWERKHELLGLNSPQRLDIVQLQVAEQPSGHQKIYEMIMRLARPGWQPGDGDVAVGDGNGKAEPSDS